MAPKTFSLSRRTMTIAASSALALGGVFALTTTFPSAVQADPAQKVWVCKFVGKPGVDERLKDGKNPIHVSWNSITGSDQEPYVGAQFSDAQGRSVVVSLGKADPGKAACEEIIIPPTTTTTTVTTTTTSTPPVTTTTTSKTPPVTKTTTNTPPVTKTTTSTGTHTTQPSTPGGGGSATPGVGAPKTGGAGEGNPVNGLIGSGLLLSAAGLLAFDTLKRRRNALGKSD